MPIPTSLFEELAKAKAQPSRAFRAAQAGIGAAEEGLKGYLTGQEIADSIRQRQLKQQTLGEALGGQPIEEGLTNLTAEQGVLQHPNLEIAAAFEKAKHAGPNPERMIGIDQATKALSGVVKKPSPEDLKFLQSFQNGQIPESEFSKYFSARATQQNAIPRNEFFGTRTGQISLQQLPSQMGQNTGAGAAFSVKVAARQGKSLIAKPGPAQNISLATSDLARAVQRSAPQLDVLYGADYSKNLLTRLSGFQQKLTADPSGPDVPKIRKALYDEFDALDKSATPFITNHLQNYEDLMAPLPDALKRRESGEALPDIPFDPGASSSPSSGMVRITASDGTIHDIPQQNLGRAKQIDPGLQVNQ